MKKGIFINYRRDDSHGMAGRIYDRLCSNFSKKDIFFDVDNVLPGSNFVDSIETAIDKCDIFLVLIGKNWPTYFKQDFANTDNKREDFVEFEITTAIKKGVTIIPILFDGAKMPLLEQLPDSCKVLARINAVQIRHERFESDFEGLLKVLKKFKAKIGSSLSIDSSIPLSFSDYLKNAKLNLESKDYQKGIRNIKIALQLEPNNADAKKIEESLQKEILMSKARIKKKWKLASLFFLSVAAITGLVWVTILILNSNKKIELVVKDGIVEVTNDSLLVFYDDNTALAGYKNLKGGIVIPPKYDFASLFYEGLAIVSINEKYGYINKLGQEVIPLKYENAWSFSEGIANVQLGGKIGFINKKGSLITPFKFDASSYDYEFHNGVAIAKVNKKYGIVSSLGKELTLFKYERISNYKEGYFQFRMNGKCGFIDINGSELIKPQYDDVKDYSEGYAQVRLKNKIGFINIQGKEVIPLIYDFATDFLNGVSTVKIGKKLFIINKAGHIKENLNYEVIHGPSVFTNGLIIAKSNHKYGVVTTSGNLVIQFKYDLIHEYVRKGNYVKVKLRNKFGLLKISGDEVLPTSFEDIDGSFSEGLTAVKLNKKWGFVDTLGKLVIPCQYDKVSTWGFENGFVAVKYNGGIGYIDKLGKQVISFKYDGASSFDGGLFHVKLNGKSGAVDISGREVIPIIYDNVSIYSEGLYGVKNSDSIGFVNRIGKLVIPMNYKKYSFYEYFVKGVGKVIKDNKEILINKRGEYLRDLDLNFEKN